MSTNGDTQVAKECKKEPRKDVLIINVLFFTCALIVLGFSIVLIIYRNRVWAYKRISEQGNVGLTEVIALQSFTYDELEKVTEGFKEELRRGSFGSL